MISPTILGRASRSRARCASGRSLGSLVPAVVRVAATDGLRVRRTPDTTSRDNVLGGLAPPEEIEALERDGEWLRVSYRGQRAFIHGGFVELAPAYADEEPAAGHAQAAPAPRRRPCAISTVPRLVSGYAEEERAAERQRTGGRVHGRRAVLAQSWRDQPASHEPRRNLRPRIATRSTWGRLEALLRDRAFAVDYADARARWKDGDAAVFPPGTYWLQRFASVPIRET